MKTEEEIPFPLPLRRQLNMRRGVSAEKLRQIRPFRSPIVNQNLIGLPQIVKQMPKMYEKLQSLEVYNKESRKL